MALSRVRCGFALIVMHVFCVKTLLLKITLKRDREGSLVSRGSGIMPEYLKHCESGFVQRFDLLQPVTHRSRLAEL